MFRTSPSLPPFSFSILEPTQLTTKGWPGGVFCAQVLCPSFCPHNQYSIYVSLAKVINHETILRSCWGGKSLYFKVQKLYNFTLIVASSFAPFVIPKWMIFSLCDTNRAIFSPQTLHTHYSAWTPPHEKWCEWQIEVYCSRCYLLLLYHSFVKKEIYRNYSCHWWNAAPAQYT